MCLCALHASGETNDQYNFFYVYKNANFDIRNASCRSSRPIAPPFTRLETSVTCWCVDPLSAGSYTRYVTQNQIADRME